jgi:hypothetical protein
VATTLNPIDSLYARLNAAGISTGFARKVLPAWWDNAAALTPSGLQQAQMYFARAFNIDLASLAQPKGALHFLGAERKFKLSRNVTQEDVFVSAHYVTAMAKLALRGFKKTQSTVPLDPIALRTALLKQNDCVSLTALLAWCAEVGIPVLHIDKLPGKKMTGLVVREDDRFAIVLSKKVRPAHLLFHLAHELGHIGHQHLAGNGFVADQSIGQADAGDTDEKEADAYAIRLLNGKEVVYRAGTTLRSGEALYKAALVKAKQEKIDVGHIILNYGNAQGVHALATNALKLIAGEADGAKVVNQAFFKAIDTGALSEDQLDLLTTAVGNSASL